MSYIYSWVLARQVVQQAYFYFIAQNNKH